MFHVKQYDVIVVGAGHAGVEAALAAARRNARTALITFRKSDLGVMSCNPAIGGIGKGHLVREIDALDGMMGCAGDYAAIQYRLLNRSRGPAVQGPRVQADRERYAAFVQRYVAAQQGLDVIEAEVVDIRVDSGEAKAIVLADGSEILARAIVLATGTFLRGEIHVGTERIAAGRRGAPAAERLGDRLREAADGIGRLKTGTPARLVASSIDWGVIGEQPGDEYPEFLSFQTSTVQARQVPCGVTETNARTHEIIAKNLHLSAMHVGNISGVGPRYCPSIEDKVVRFAEKSGHNVFLEPEGLSSELVYPNGISTSLPGDVQIEFLRSIKGLENVEVRHIGYAIEYDYLDPRGLRATLEHRHIAGLFLAGQINGTTGYEEAGAQGLLAGANAAARATGAEELVLSRFDSYIGVMIDDLIHRGVSEPYRMFTSRAEYRLSIRADNADQRLTPIGVDTNLVSEDRKQAFDEKMNRLQASSKKMSADFVDPDVALALNLLVSKTGKKRSWRDAAGQLVAEKRSCADLLPYLPGIDLSDLEQVGRDAFYEPYLERQLREAERLKRENAVMIPQEIDYTLIASLSNELKTKLSNHRPNTLGEAERIEGMTPAAMSAVLAHIRLQEKRHRVAR
ncbi:tRNA uridine-5-carboxymethylaminomethyl(34) synthesis enzyme MnmG [Pararhodobacter marinus]|uniref:tRNA uridine 5-carboxymethylaminomethyl modification enzyme MnmG n=1 Tax=Pararhodobacter marinus TaxID=2184063 RepID=A0A2U2CIV2_9RHOB|nr:tRNA uridine-5-carboxymethylaminomethyl(34) synthesis enzyme MnmG [Pararhodobacter marinus]PWE31796.1 tRNA uridine-5-carboxymethylaminomethyl(34) synthesis enzyme MnmG [Pararhodobacter marinus]